MSYMQQMHPILSDAFCPLQDITFVVHTAPGRTGKDSASFVKQGQQVVRQCDAPNQGQVPVCNLNEGLGRPRTLLLRHQPCMQVDML